MRTPAAPPRAFLREPRHVVACLRLLVFMGLAVLGWSAPPGHPYLFWTVTVIYGATVLGYLAAGNREFGLRRVRLAIFLFDAAVVAGLLLLRGRDAQMLVMAYFMLVLLAALLAGVGNALSNGLVVSALFVVVGGWGEPPVELLTFDRVASVLFFFVIAVFLGHVAGESRAGRRRSQRGGPGPDLAESTARLRAARDEARATERLHTLGLLAAGIAHEIRLPLSALQAGCREGPELLEALRGREEPDADAASMLRELADVFQDCAHAVGRLQRVAADLSAVAGGSREASRVTLSEALTGAARLLQRAACASDVQIEIDARSARCLHVDAARLQQVLLLLADNAISAMPGGGTLTLGAYDVGADRLALIVQDTGVGMGRATQARMYDPFFTTKEAGNGTGLGLFVLREIVHAQGGRVTCDSARGRGTSFRVEFPALPVATEADAA